MKKTSVVFFLLFFLAFAGIALAATIPELISQQRHRIQQGIEKGQLTQGEAATLQANLDHIKAEHEKAVARGTLSKNRDRIMNLIERNSEMIYKKRHNVIQRLY